MQALTTTTQQNKCNAQVRCLKCPVNDLCNMHTRAQAPITTDVACLCASMATMAHFWATSDNAPTPYDIEQNLEAGMLLNMDTLKAMLKSARHLQEYAYNGFCTAVEDYVASFLPEEIADNFLG